MDQKRNTRYFISKTKNLTDKALALEEVIDNRNKFYAEVGDIDVIDEYIDFSIIPTHHSSVPTQVFALLTISYYNKQ